MNIQCVAWGNEGQNQKNVLPPTDLVIIVIAVTVDAKMGFLWCFFPFFRGTRFACFGLISYLFVELTHLRPKFPAEDAFHIPS